MPKTILLEQETAIIQAVQNGNLEAFELLLTSYEKPIFNYLYRFTNHREDAEDLTQETFIKAFSHIKTFDLEKKFSTWLYTIATNTVYDALRKKQRKPELFIINDDDNNFETIDPKDAYEVVDMNLDINDALAKIKPHYRTVLLLFYQQGLSYEEIAETMAVPLNTVKTYLHRAKASLKQIIK